MRKLALSAAVFLISSPAMAQDAEWAESPQFFFANEGVTAEQTYQDREVAFRAPLRWLRAIRLEAGRTATIGDEEHEFAAGAVLPQLKFLPDGTDGNAITAYCTPRNRGENSIRSGFGAAMFGGVLTDSLVRDLSDTQYCLHDSDDDGLLDSSFLVGEGENDFVSGQDIDPVGFANADHARISEDQDEIRLVLDNVGRRRVTFELELFQQGHTISFDSVTSGIVRAQRYNRVDMRDGYPAAADIFGTRFDIIAHDRREDTVTISWPQLDELVQVIIPENYRRLIF